MIPGRGVETTCTHIAFTSSLPRLAWHCGAASVRSRSARTRSAAPLDGRYRRTGACAPIHREGDPLQFCGAWGSVIPVSGSLPCRCTRRAPGRRGLAGRLPVCGGCLVGPGKLPVCRVAGLRMVWRHTARICSGYCAATASWFARSAFGSANAIINSAFWPLAADDAASVHLMTAAPERGKGLATRLKQCSAERLRAMGFARLYSRIWWTNTASLRVSEKAGGRKSASSWKSRCRGDMIRCTMCSAGVARSGQRWAQLYGWPAAT